MGRFFVSRSCGQDTRRGSTLMNDMTWDGTDTPEGPFAAIEALPEGDRVAVAGAIERVKRPNDLDEVAFASALM